MVVFRILKKLDKFEILLLFIFFVFSYILMWKTFQVTPEGDLKIASKVWSDFAATIPLTRSFSMGSNFPIEHPLFPGEPIRYHFLFYLMVGVLEHLGLRIDFALNILSSISFTFLLFMIYLLGKTLFQKRTIGILSVFLFLFNGSFSFIEFFKQYPLSINTPINIIKNTAFPSFGPYDGKIVSAFWNLNIYTNQRHLALSFALALLIIYLIYCKFNYKNRLKLSLYIFFILGILVLLNKAAFAVTLPFIFFFLIFKPQKKVLLIIGSFLTIIFFLLWLILTENSGIVKLKYGYLINEPLNLFSFIRYWFYNFGLYTIFIPIGYFIAPKNAKKLMPSLIILFAVANIFQFSTDIINNHKFFNFFLIFGSVYSANFLSHLLEKNLNFVRLIVPLLIIFLTLSGIIDYFAILNDKLLTIKDVSTNPDAYFFSKKTPSQSVILNSTFLYHPASIAGRKIFHGYPYFTWSYGYDKDKREKILVSIYRAKSKNEACSLLLKNNISYVELNDKPEDFILPNWELWRINFDLLYENQSSGINVYDIGTSCQSFSSNLKQISSNTHL